MNENVHFGLFYAVADVVIVVAVCVCWLAFFVRPSVLFTFAFLNLFFFR